MASSCAQHTSEAKQTGMSEFRKGKRFTARPSKQTSQLIPWKASSLPKGFGKVFLKDRWRGEASEVSSVPDQCFAQFSDWLMVRKQGGITGVNIISPETPDNMLIVITKFLHLVRVGGGGISHLQNDSGNVHQILLSISWYFREELIQRVWGEACPRKAP